MTKRVPIAKPAKPGELKALWGRADRHDGPDVCYVWGQGVDRADGRLLHTYLSTERMTYAFPSMDIKYEPSLLDELEARGYDITTLKISIKKKVDPTQ